MEAQQQYVRMSKPCKEFQGYKDRDGYGRVYNPRTKRQYPAHRKVFEDAYGVLPSTVVVRHSCDNAGCIELDHLIDGTQADNIADKVLRGRCAAGHDNGMATVSNADVELCRSIYTGRRGELTALGKRFGVSRVTIRNWVSGVTR